MFSNLYYLSKLIDNSFSFSDIEKIKIFNLVKKKPNKITDLIKVLKEEKKGINYIKNNYQKNLKNLSENYKKDLLNWKKEKEYKEKRNIRNKVIEMKFLEENEKTNEDKDLENIINKI